MTYETIARIVQQGGTLYFILIFVVGVGVALLPRNKELYRRAAQLPLEEDHDDVPA
ncbi:MAG TPA: cbb3-type cytochrome c oxidase subunit 3 [Caulobacteraceae bacterium]